MKSIRPHTLAAGALLALQALSAQAQSSVTLYGLLDLSVGQKQLAGEKKITNVSSGQMTTSRWGLTGSEDLGDGLRANFDLGSFLRGDTGESGRSSADAFWGRFAWVGLSGDFGQLRMGRITTAGFVTAIRFGPFADSTGLGPFLLHTYLNSATQPLMTGNGTADSAWNNSVAYSTPTLGGLVGSLMVSAGEGTTAGRRVGLGLLYGSAGNPLSAGFSYEKTSDAALSIVRRNPSLGTAQGSATVTDLTTATLGISYDLQVVKLFGQYSDSKLEALSSDIRLKSSQLGVSVPIGNGKLLASVARTTKTETARLDASRTTTSLGYDLDLSKRTDVYAVTMLDKTSDLSRGTSLAVGIRHRF